MNKIPELLHPRLDMARNVVEIMLDGNKDLVNYNYISENPNSKLLIEFYYDENKPPLYEVELYEDDELVLTNKYEIIYFRNVDEFQSYVQKNI